MFNSPVLDVTIGLVLIFFLYSLLATTIRESIATLFGYFKVFNPGGIKKIFIIASIILASNYTIRAQQSAYYDAMFIYTNCYSEDDGLFTNRSDLFAVLQKYYRSDTLSEEELKKNPFFKKFVPEFGRITGGRGVFSESATSLGNLNVTNFADGLAKFLVARAKEELNVAFFRKFQEYMQGYPEVKIIFPATSAILSKIYSYQYTIFLPALRAGFQKDMNSFSEHFLELRNLTATDCHSNASCESRISALTSFLNDNPVGKSIVSTLIVSDNLVRGINPAEMLDNIEADRICLGQSDNFSNIIRFSNLISNSLRSKEPEEVWVTKDEIKTLVTNDVTFQIYMGLIYASNEIRDSPISFSLEDGSSLPLEKLLRDASVDLTYYTEVKNNIKAIGNLAAQTSFFAKKIRINNSESNPSSILIYADYASSLSDLLKHTVTFFDSKNQKLKQDVNLFTTLIDDATDACYDIKSQNYTALVLHTSDILGMLLQDKFSYKDDFIKYGTFMANIIEADNSNEVKEAIEAAVLPVGSSSIKRETYSNISLNAFIGPMVGMEYLPGLTQNQMAPVVGITAPLGLAFNWGNQGNGKRDEPITTRMRNGREVGGKSYSLFFPLIDVGALSTFRISDDSSNVAADIKLANIIAPGVYFYWGLGKVPVSIGLGAQVGPQLRDINAEVVNIDKNFYVRAGLNVVVDIPFFNFYTRNSRTKNK